MKTKTYSVSEARNHWAEILAAVEQGEEVAITKYGDTVASITPARKPKKRTAPPPGFMLAEGWKIEIADDFDSIPKGKLTASPDSRSGHPVVQAAAHQSRKCTSLATGPVGSNAASWACSAYKVGRISSVRGPFTDFVAPAARNRTVPRIFESLRLPLRCAEYQPTTIERSVSFLGGG